MFGRLVCAVATLAVSSISNAADPDTVPLPTSIAALSGCWEGRGDANGKPVAIFVAAYPIVRNAMLAIEAASSVPGDPDDDYAAHLVLGGARGDRIVGYWADSFGGAFAASGQGESRAGGFDITYRYSNGAFLNRWRISGNDLTWQIVRPDGKGGEKPFADYRLRKTACRSDAAG